VDQYVYTAEAFVCEFQQGVDIALLAHICTTKAGGSACHLDPPNGPLSTVLIDIGNDNDRTFTGEALGDRTTAAHSPGTGDDCDSIFNVHLTPRCRSFSLFAFGRAIGTGVACESGDLLLEIGGGYACGRLLAHLGPTLHQLSGTTAPLHIAPGRF